MPKLILRAPGNYDPDSASKEAGLYCADPSRAIQSQAVDADINTIVKRFGLTGELPNNLRAPLDLDFVDVVDYRTALDQIREADRVFMRLPADVRARFDNDAASFVDFCSDVGNADEMKKMGLKVPNILVEETVAPADSPPA